MVYIRPACGGDVPAILEIYTEEILTGTATFHCETQTLEERRQWLFSLLAHGYPCIVADAVDEYGEPIKQTVGWCNLSRYSERQAYDTSAEISLYVHKDFRGKKVGQTLLHSLLTGVRKSQRFHTIIAKVATENTATVHFWERNGFQRSGVLREVGKKFGRWLDVAFYQLVL